MTKRLRMIRDVLLLLWVALLPLQTRLFLHRGEFAGGAWEYGTLSLYVTDLLLISAFALSLLVDHDRLWLRPAALSRTLVMSILAAIFCIVFSSINALDVGVALGASTHILLGLVAWWLIVKSDIPTSRFALFVILSASLEGVLALLQFAMQSVPASTIFGLAVHLPSVSGDAVIETVYGRFLRAYGTLPHPNMLAGWLSFGLVCASGLYLRSKDRLERAVLLVVFCIITTGLFLTFSRAGLLGWITVLIMLVTGVLLRERRESSPRWHLGFLHRDIPTGLKAMKLVVVSVLLLGLFLSFFNQLVQGRSDLSNRLEAKSINDRVVQLDEARGIIGKYWLFGVGVGNYTRAVADVVDPGRQAWGYEPVHNVALLALAEVGAVGSLILLWFLGIAIREMYRMLRQEWGSRSGGAPSWGAVMNLALVLLLLLSLVDHYLWSLPFGIFLTALVFGLWAKNLSDN